MHYDLQEANVSDEFLAKVKKAQESFWNTFSSEFTEVTSGDSQLCDEPANTLATWIAPYDNVTLPVLPLAKYNLNLPDGCSKSRVEKTLNKAIKNIINDLKDDIPVLKNPTPELKQSMYLLYSDVLHWNYLEKKTKKNRI